MREEEKWKENNLLQTQKKPEVEKINEKISNQKNSSISQSLAEQNNSNLSIENAAAQAKIFLSETNTSILSHSNVSMYIYIYIFYII